MLKYKLVYDNVIQKQLRKATKNKQIHYLLSKIFDKIEEKGPAIGELVDSHLFIYEIKLKKPPIRLYFKHNLETNEIYVIEYEMKTSEEKQQNTINKLKNKIFELFRTLNLFWYIFYRP